MAEFDPSIQTPPYHALLTAEGYWYDRQPVPAAPRAARLVDILCSDIDIWDVKDQYDQVRTALPDIEVTPIAVGTALADHRKARLVRMVIDEFEPQVRDNSILDHARADFFDGRARLFNRAAHLVTQEARMTHQLRVPPQASLYWRHGQTDPIQAIHRRLAYGVATMSYRQIQALSGPRITTHTDLPEDTLRFSTDVQVGVPYAWKPIRGTTEDRLFKVASADALTIYRGEDDDGDDTLVGIASEYLGTLLRTRTNPLAAT